MAASPIKRMTLIDYTPQNGEDWLEIAFMTICALEGESKCGGAIANTVYTKLTHDEIDNFIHKMFDQLGEEAVEYFGENLYITSGG